MYNTTFIDGATNPRLTDNEGYYEDSLNVEKLEDKYKLERVNQEKQLKMSKSFNEGERSHEVKVSRTSSLKKFNSEGNICVSFLKL